MSSLSKKLISKFKKVKLLIVDVDGVLSRPYLIMGGEVGNKEVHEYRTFNVHDGSACWIAKESGLILAIVSGRDSESVRVRAKKIKIDEVYLGNLDKIELFENLKKKYGLIDDEIGFITDDFLDLPLFKKVGVAIAVNDAVEEIKESADFITKAEGGKGALREIIRIILKVQKKWDKNLQKILRDVYST